MVNGPDVSNGYIKQRHIHTSCLWDDVTAARIQFMAGFHSGGDTGGKTGFLEKAYNMRGWKIILLANSGAFEGKFVLLSCSLQELSLIKVVK